MAACPAFAEDDRLRWEIYAGEVSIELPAAEELRLIHSVKEDLYLCEWSGGIISIIRFGHKALLPAGAVLFDSIAVASVFLVNNGFKRRIANAGRQPVVLSNIEGLPG